MVEKEDKKKHPCELFDDSIEDKVANLLAEGKEVPENMMACYEESRKMKKIKGESIP